MSLGFCVKRGVERMQDLYVNSICPQSEEGGQAAGVDSAVLKN